MSNKVNRLNVCYTNAEKKLLDIMQERLDAKSASALLRSLKIAEVVTRPDIVINQKNSDGTLTELKLII